MRRILMVILILVAVIFLITQGGVVANVIQRGQGVTSLILSLLQLAGVALGLAFVVFVLVRYAQYVRSRRFIFEGFSNASKLINAENMPLDLDMLAQEELVTQFEIIFNELKGYSDKESKDFESLVADELYIEEDPSGNDIGIYVTIDQIKKSGMIVDLNEVLGFLTNPEVFRSLTNLENINSIKLVSKTASKVVINPLDPAEEIAPKEVVPILKFIEALFPPHIIRATCHLQWRSDIPGRAGITFNLVDLGSQRNLMFRTLWWQPSDKTAASVHTQSSTTSNMANEALTNKATDHYIELLKPAMHWLALMFWEQNLISHVPRINRILLVREKRRQARILFLLGAMYYAHADQFQAYKSFFRQLGVEHLRQSSLTDSNWWLPYMYLANFYTFKAQETKGAIHNKLFKEAMNLYDKALVRTYMSGITGRYTRARIILAKALAELVLGVATKDEGIISVAIKEVEELQLLIDPADFDPARADCAAFLYNMATWYELAYDTMIDVPNPIEKARRYLAYSLTRSLSLWDRVENDENFKSIRNEGDLEILKKELDKKLSEKPELVEMTGEHFKTEINKILEKVDQLLGRPGR